jgi:hypothetical protein
MKQIEAERDRIIQQQQLQMQQQQSQQIVMQVPGGEPRALNMQEVVGIIQQQQQHLQVLSQRNQELETIVMQLQQQLGGNIGNGSHFVVQPQPITPMTYTPPIIQPQPSNVTTP